MALTIHKGLPLGQRRRQQRRQRRGGGGRGQRAAGPAGVRWTCCWPAPWRGSRRGAARRIPTTSRRRCMAASSLRAAPIRRTSSGCRCRTGWRARCLHPHVEVANRRRPRAAGRHGAAAGRGPAVGEPRRPRRGALSPAIGRCCRVRSRTSIAEPKRAGLVPGFFDVKAAALAAGALGCSLSGSGPVDLCAGRSLDEAQRAGEAHAAAPFDRRK